MNGTALGDRTPSAVLDAAVVSRVLDAHNARPLRIQAAVTPTPPPPAALELFRGGYRTLRPFLREWLVAAADHGYRLPAEDLPLLRTLVEEEPHPYSAFHAARLGGPPLWYMAVGVPVHPGDPVGLFKTGTTEDWARYLTALRHHEPDRALALLQVEWQRPWSADQRLLRVRERIRMLNTLAVNLSLDDEPFLEGLLDDRPKLTRRAAAGLLSTLPGSRYGERMADRALARVVPEGDRFAVRPAPEPDAAAERDQLGRIGRLGVAAPFTLPGVREPLVAVIAATPLDTWRRRLGLKPRETLERAANSDELVRAGFIFAVLKQRAADWAEVAVSVDLFADVLIAAIPMQDRLAQYPDAGPRKLSEAVEAEVPHPWPETLAARYLPEIVRAARGNTYWWSTVRDLAHRGLPLSCEPDIRALRDAERADGDAAARLGQLAETLAHRRALLATLDGVRPGSGPDPADHAETSENIGATGNTENTGNAGNTRTAGPVTVPAPATT